MTLKTVVQINDFGHVNGGASQVAIQTALSLARRGLRVIYFCAVPPLDASLAAEPRLEVVLTGQPEILRDPNRLRAAALGIWNPRSQAALQKITAGLDPRETVIHLHGWTKALSASVLPPLLARGFVPLLTLHDYFTACPNGGFYNYPRQEICSLRALSPACLASNCDVRSYPQKLWRFARGIVQHSAGQLPRGIRHFISLSALSERVLRPYLPPDAVLHRLPNPVAIAQTERVHAEENTRLVMVGRLAPEKGVLQAAQAAALAGQPIEFVGDGPLRAELQQVNPQALFSGWVPAEGVRARLQTARALLFCSQWYETQGLSVREAAAMGVPAVVADTSAAAEWVLPEETGWLYPARDLQSLADRISALSDSAKVMACSQAVYAQYWAAPDSPEQTVERLLEIYAQALNC